MVFHQLRHSSCDATCSSLHFLTIVCDFGGVKVVGFALVPLGSTKRSDFRPRGALACGSLLCKIFGDVVAGSLAFRSPCDFCGIVLKPSAEVFGHVVGIDSACGRVSEHRHSHVVSSKNHVAVVT